MSDRDQETEALALLREFAETDPVAYYNTGPVCPHCELTNNSSGEKIAHDPDTCLWLRARKFLGVESASDIKKEGAK